MKTVINDAEIWQPNTRQMAKILKVSQANPSHADLLEGANTIRNGGLVVFPTETVYGLGANALSEEACMKIFKAKERPADNPLIVHISSLQMLNQVADSISADLLPKLDRVWPGPVTVLLRKSRSIPDVVTGGSDLVAVRMPDNQIALKLIELSEVPIAAPSANVSTRPSITDSKYAVKELGSRVDVIFDSGPTTQGLESTIIDISGKKPVLLRAGSKAVEELSKIFGEIEVTDFSRGLKESTIPLAPGMKYRHYSPNKKLYLAASSGLVESISKLEEMESKIAIIGSSELCRESLLKCIDLGLANDLDAIGRRLFSAFRELEELSVSAGIIAPVGESGRGLAIMNRIRKASYGKFSTVEELKELIHF